MRNPRGANLHRRVTSLTRGLGLRQTEVAQALGVSDRIWRQWKITGIPKGQLGHVAGFYGTIYNKQEIIGRAYDDMVDVLRYKADRMKVSRKEFAESLGMSPRHLRRVLNEGFFSRKLLDVVGGTLNLKRNRYEIEGGKVDELVYRHIQQRPGLGGRFTFKSPIDVFAWGSGCMRDLYYDGRYSKLESAIAHLKHITIKVLYLSDILKIAEVVKYTIRASQHKGDPRMLFAALNGHIRQWIKENTSKVQIIILGT